MLKRFALSAVLVASTIAAAATLDLDQVNNSVAQLLKPFNNATTYADLRFTALEVSGDLTKDFGVFINYAKAGSKNIFSLRIPELTYKHDGDGGLPTVKGQASLKLDLVKVIGQKAINDLGEVAADLVKDTVKEVTQEYGDAATAEAVLDRLDKDEKGDVTGVKLHLTVKIDLAKLPANKPAQEEMVTSFEGSLEVTRTDAELSVTSVLNPDYVGFKKDQRGLKEFIEALNSGDEETYKEIGAGLAALDKAAEHLVQ